MNALYFDPFAGISGDMTLGAFVDLGVPEEILIQAVDALNLPGCSLRFETHVKRGISCHKALIEEGTSKPLRHLPEIESIITRASLPENVKQKSLDIIRAMGKAEAVIHGVPLEKIHFHEIGAVDTLVDVVGNVAAFCYLSPDHVFTRPVRWGTGTVKISHGEYPLPAPATEILLRGIPGFHGDIPKEWTTPTGAALLSHFVTDTEAPESFIAEKTGYGAGEREHESLANVLRIMRGRVGNQDDQIIQIETQVDDSTGEDLGFLHDLLRESNALDWYYTSIQMKKNRPGTLISVLCKNTDRAVIEEMILRHTSSIGVRHHAVDRRELTREVKNIETPWGNVRYKVAHWQDNLYNCAPEYDDCSSLAKETNMPVAEMRRMLLEHYYTVTQKK